MATLPESIDRGIPWLAGLATIVVASLLVGCGLTPNMQSARLHALAVPAATTQARCAVTFGIRDVRLAGYLDRAEIVTARTGSTIQASALDLWAAPLKDDLRRLVGRSLAQRWDGSRLMPHPWRFGEVPTLSVDLVVDRLDAQAGTFSSNIHWQMLRPATSTLLVSGAFVHTQVVAPATDAASIVAAIDAALLALTRDLAQQAVGDGAVAQLCRQN